ncbi:DUF58 domain-containing protein [Hydrogenophaga sp. 5NK40-0174]|uniref:DUF58 domain-containing protein n=1 Tax=Hydrogenophaga sp. 5NK40-0174 TaxID=3127649 RepID=UPI003106DD4C
MGSFASARPEARPGLKAGPAGTQPLQRARQRIQGWFLSRIPPSDNVELTQRNVYILPTRAGAMLALTLMVLLVGSINYQLNLGYLLTFLIAGSAAAGMHWAHGNLRGLNLHMLPPAPVHADQPAILPVKLENSARKNRHAIAVSLAEARSDAGDTAATVDVVAGGSASVDLNWAPPGRGLHALPPLRAQTFFPMGTFRVWTIWRPAARLLVYPAPEMHPPGLPAGQSDAPVEGVSRTHSSGEFDGVRPYRRGDAQKTVVWRKSANAISAGRSELVSRDNAGAQHTQLWLDQSSCGASGKDAQLSRLTAWVLLADRLDLDYGLRVGGQEIAPASGQAHKAACLERLALC